MPKSPKVCFDRILPRHLLHPHTPPRPGLPRTRAAFEIGKLWQNGSALRVRFLEGTAAQKDTVGRIATEWTHHANLKLNFGDAPDAEIRVAFRDDGAWSYIGRDCLDIPRDQPTMNFGWLDEGVVLHEFGHAIGLIHEHQNPHGGIKWNREAVIRDLSGPPNFWDPATIEHNMFAKYAVDQINGTALDKKSIMLYAIPAGWTTDGFSSVSNEALSAVDAKFAGSEQNYPFDAPPTGGPTTLQVSEATAVEADLGTGGEEDLYQFAATKPARYTVQTEGPTDVVMALFGPDSRTMLIAEDDDSGSDRNARIAADLLPGNYFVQVRHYNPASGTGSYRIMVSR